MISGTAVDGGSGIVAGVEVSTDDGATWHPAIGRESWTFTWTPAASGTAVLKSRAVDDSGNQEIPSAGVSVSVQRVCPCSLWNDSTIPAVAVGSVVGAHRSRGEIPRRHGRLHHRAAVPQRGRQRRNARRQSVDRRRHASEERTVHDRDRALAGRKSGSRRLFRLSAASTYVASYHAPNGHFSVDRPYFAAADFYNAPLRAPRDVAGRAERGFQERSAAASRRKRSDRATTGSTSCSTRRRWTSRRPPSARRRLPPTRPGSRIAANVTVTFSETMNPASITTRHDRAAERRRIAGACRGHVQRRDQDRDARSDGPAPELDAYTAIVRGGPTGVKDLAGNAMPSRRELDVLDRRRPGLSRARSGQTPRRLRSRPIRPAARSSSA